MLCTYNFDNAAQNNLASLLLCVLCVKQKARTASISIPNQ